MKDIIAINHGTGQIDLRHVKNVAQLKPTELHLKENGTIQGNPSLVIVMEGPVFNAVGQVSIEMLDGALNELGYKITKV